MSLGITLYIHNTILGVIFVGKDNFELRRQEGHMRPAKIQISLRIRTGWPESSLGAFSWIAEEIKFLHADNEDSDQTARMRRLIWVFVGRTCQKVRFLTVRLIWFKALFLLTYWKHLLDNLI